MILAIRNLAHESQPENRLHFLNFHMEKSVSTIWISPCDSLGKFLIASIQHKKRLSKESMKEIQEFVLKSKNSFAINDLIVVVKEKTNKDVKDYEVRKYLKDGLKMSYRKWTIKSWFVDTIKLSVFRIFFYIRISQLITPLPLIINIDETTFNHKIASNISWIGKKHFCELFNSNFVGSWSLILAITSDGMYFELIKNTWIDSLIYFQFLKHLEKWIETKIDMRPRKVIVFQDNCQVHRALKVRNFIQNSKFSYVYIPIYIPEYSPVETMFSILKFKCKSDSHCRHINWWKEEGARLIFESISLIESSHIVAIWRNFIQVVKQNMKQFINIIKELTSIL